MSLDNRSYNTCYWSIYFSNPLSNIACFIFYFIFYAATGGVFTVENTQKALYPCVHKL